MAYRDPAKQAEASRRHYEANKPAMVARAIRHSADRRAANREIVIAAKCVPCADCGGSFPTACMDFDHVGGDKSANVSDLARRAVTEVRLRAEIAKCEVVCANCHRIRTAQRKQFYRGGQGPRDTHESDTLEARHDAVR